MYRKELLLQAWNAVKSVSRAKTNLGQPFCPEPGGVKVLDPCSRRSAEGPCGPLERSMAARRLAAAAGDCTSYERSEAVLTIHAIGKVLQLVRFQRVVFQILPAQHCRFTRRPSTAEVGLGRRQR